MLELTDSQAVAIEQDGLLILSACPGSGKTTVVAHRLRRLIAKKNLLPYQGIAVLSFTNVAKESIIQMYSELVGKPLSYPHFVGTIDSFLNTYFIRVVGHRLLAKQSERVNIIDVRSTWIDERFGLLNKYMLSGQNITYDRNGNIVYQQRDRAINPEANSYIGYVKSELHKHNLITQSDVSYFCLEILRRFPDFRRAFYNRFPFIIVDEAQDCSETQMAIIDELKRRGHPEIMLLGDPYQSIYEWRDANPQLLLDKERDVDWTSLSITETQRCGGHICEFLNRFHAARTIHQDTHRTELNDAEVIVKRDSDFDNALGEFLARVTMKGIVVNQVNVAVLYGGHKSIANIKRSKIDEKTLFAVKNAEIQALPLKAKIHYDRSQFRQAYECICRYFYFVIEHESLKSTKHLREHRLNSISNKIKLWNICKRLPSLQMALLDWIAATNTLLKEAADSYDVAILELKKKKTQAAIADLRGALLLEPGDQKYSRVTMQNIHQIKGRTFDAVMIYVDSGPGQWKLSVKKIKESLQQRDLFGSEHLDDTRCFYVAASRARRLLWISSKDKDIETIFNG